MVNDDGAGDLTLTGSCFTGVSAADVSDAGPGYVGDVSNGFAPVTEDGQMTVYYVAGGADGAVSGDSCTVTVTGPGGSGSYSYTATG